MVGDMFNNALKSKLDAVCTELAAYVVAETPSASRGRNREAVEASYRSKHSDWWPAGLGTPRVCWDSSGVYHGGSKMDHGSEALIGLVGAHGDTFEFLQFAEEVLN